MVRKILVIALAVVSSPVLAEQYLVDFKVGTADKGDYILSVTEKAVMAPPALFAAVGIPASESLPLDTLSDYGELVFDQSHQVVQFQPSDPALLPRNQFNPERHMVQIDRPVFEGKSVDYFVTHNSVRETSGYLLGTGRAGPADLDLRAGFGTSDSFFSAQWHDDDNQWVKDVQAGRVQRYGLDGLSITNESRLATSSFASDRIELYWPVGTRIDVYRSGAYQETITVDREPFYYDLDLVAAQNKFEFRAILPDGRSDVRTYDRRVDGQLAPVGQISYSLSAGNDYMGDNQVYGRVGYGLSSYASIFAGRDNLYDGYLSMLASRNGLTGQLLAHGGDTPGYAGALSFYSDHIGASYTHRDAATESSSYLLRAPSLWGTPQYQRTDTDTGRHKTTLERFSVRQGFALGATHINLAPYFERAERASGETDEYGMSSIISHRSGFRFGLDISHEEVKKYAFERTKIKPEISFRAWPGRIAYRTEFLDEGNGWTNRRHDLDVNVWQWDFATLSGGWSKVKGGDSYFTLTVSGSFGNHGLTRSHQARSAEFTVMGCDDRNLDGVCQDDEPPVERVPVTYGARDHVSPARISGLSPYQAYDFEVGGVFGYEPVERYLTTDDLPRGSQNRIAVPLRKIEEVEGRIESGLDGVDVALVDKVTGELIETQKTSFGGWYLFYAPAGVDVEVREIEVIERIHIGSVMKP